jgi:hypothetical protein
MIVEFQIKNMFDNRSNEPFTAEVSIILDCEELPDWFYSDSELFGEEMRGYWGFNIKNKRSKCVTLSHFNLAVLNTSVTDLIEDSLNLLKEVKKQREEEINLIVPFKKITHHV